MIKTFLLVMFIAACTPLMHGCGSLSTLRGDGETSFVTLSHSKGGGIVGAFTGKTSVCKMSEHSPRDKPAEHHYFLQLDGDKCFVEVFKDALPD